MNNTTHLRTLIGVIGASDADQASAREAYALGREAALRGYGLVCGGLGGVMEAACRGARETDTGALVVGVLPGYRKEDANPYV
ncbi:MAG: TIGR00725 family protein, partial [Spirochaetota bacterium]